MRILYGKYNCEFVLHDSCIEGYRKFVDGGDVFGITIYTTSGQSHCFREDGASGTMHVTKEQYNDIISYLARLV